MTVARIGVHRSGRARVTVQRALATARKGSLLTMRVTSALGATAKCSLLGMATAANQPHLLLDCHDCGRDLLPRFVKTLQEFQAGL